MAPKKDKADKADKGKAAKAPGDEGAECCTPVFFYPLMAVFGIGAILLMVQGIGQYMKVIEETKPYKEDMKKLRGAIAEWASNNHLKAKSDDAIVKLAELEEDIEKELLLYDRRRMEYSSAFRSKPGTRLWTRYGKSNYYISERKKNWYEAERFCAVRDSHLASILSYEEQDFITSQILEPAWIGLSKQNVFGSWEWTDKSSLATPYWSNEKSNSEHKEGTAQDCVTIGTTINNYNWRQVNCYKLNRWVCKSNQEQDKS